MNVENMKEIKIIDERLNEIWDSLSEKQVEKNNFNRIINDKLNYILNTMKNDENKSIVLEFINDIYKIDIEKEDNLLRYYFYIHSQIKLIELTINLNENEYNHLIHFISKLKFNNDKNLKFDYIKKQIRDNAKLHNIKFLDNNLENILCNIILLNYYYSKNNIVLPIKPRCDKMNV